MKENRWFGPQKNCPSCGVYKGQLHDEQCKITKAIEKNEHEPHVIREHKEE